MSLYGLEYNISNLIKAIGFCIEKRLFLPCLTLLYSGIDIIAWLDRPESKPDVQGADFINWIEKYLLPDSEISCNGIDLYSARCAILHSYTAESKKTREDEAKKIYYCWGEAKIEDLQKEINSQGNSSAIPLHIEKLFEAFVRGVGRFVKETDIKKMELIIQRSNKMLSNLPQKK